MLLRGLEVLNQVIPIDIFSLTRIIMFLLPLVHTQFLGRYFNDCNKIYNYNRMQQYGISLEKYEVTQSGHFRLATTVALGMGITDGKLLFCHGVSERNVDKKISTRE